MKNDVLRGVFPPLVSPCDEKGALDEGALIANLNRLLRSPIDGFYLCGGTGDGNCLTEAERERIVEITLPLIKEKGRGAIVHVGMAGIETALRLAGHAARHHADAVASVPPSASWDDIVVYYQRLATCGMPVIVYYIPAMTGVTGTAEDIARILSIPGVAGIKMTDWSVFLLSQVRERFPDQVIYTGKDEQLLFGLLSGADGAIGTWANLMPEVFCAMHALCKRADYAPAVALQRRFMAFLNRCDEVDVINAFERLMRERGYTLRNFRKPDFKTIDFDPAPLLTEAGALSAAAEKLF